MYVCSFRLEISRVNIESERIDISRLQPNIYLFAPLTAFALLVFVICVWIIVKERVPDRLERVSSRLAFVSPSMLIVY